MTDFNAPIGYMPPDPSMRRAEAGKPESIRRAVLAMKVGAAAQVLVAILGLALGPDLTQAVHDQLVRQGQPVNDAIVSAAVSFGIVFMIITVLLQAGAWIWMAVMNDKGRRWARVLSTVFWALSVASILLSLVAQSALPAGTTNNGAVGLMGNIVLLVIGGYAVWMCFRPESSAYYASYDRR